MIWDIPFGEGRVLTTVMGHSPESMHCIGFIATLQRGAEYAATGEVTLKLPEGFPGTEEPSVRE
jgi:hypothetical protein